MESSTITVFVDQVNGVASIRINDKVLVEGPFEQIKTGALDCLREYGTFNNHNELIQNIQRKMKMNCVMVDVEYHGYDSSKGPG